MGIPPFVIITIRRDIQSGRRICHVVSIASPPIILWFHSKNDRAYLVICTVSFMLYQSYRNSGLQRICFVTMESVSLLCLETDCRFWIVSLCVEGRYCLFDPIRQGSEFFLSYRRYDFSRASSAQRSFGSEKSILRPDYPRAHEISLIHLHEKAGDWELWGKFLRRIRDVAFARKQIEKYVQGIRIMTTLWFCKSFSARAHVCLHNFEIVFFRKRTLFRHGQTGYGCSPSALNALLCVT
jgi:hypothetical protein